jgi:hypothetical protein
MMMYTAHHTQYVHIWATCRQWVNGQNINSEEWFVWREIYFSYRRTTFIAWLLVDSHFALLTPPHTPLPPPGTPKKSGDSEGAKALLGSPAKS